MSCLWGIVIAILSCGIHTSAFPRGDDVASQWMDKCEAALARRYQDSQAAPFCNDLLRHIFIIVSPKIGDRSGNYDLEAVDTLGIVMTSHSWTEEGAAGTRKPKRPERPDMREEPQTLALPTGRNNEAKVDEKEEEKPLPGRRSLRVKHSSSMGGPLDTDSRGFSEFKEVKDFVNLGLALICVLFAALASGLTIGLLSIDTLDLEIKQRAGTPTDKHHAAAILPLLAHRHLLLVTLLLFNSMAAEALPLALGELVPAS
ncbi:protein of unknown function DUF21 [Nannochloropsis gaditana]|uniref:CNNM transmembrane domain-containing protein n=1 Tax=Nannochloropsis gaditana TaxID=72520 RepID=W7T0X9_9STRA|nr:protein of unknown function DUF21 [Nannochloropsis gaditana]